MVRTAVSFNGGNSADPQGEPLKYAWNFGDGTTPGAGVSPSHTFTTPGTYFVTLTVTNTSNLSATATTTAMIAAATPTANAGGPYTSVTGTAVNLSGGGSTDPQGEPLTYLWNFGDGRAQGAGVNQSHAYSRPGRYVVTLTVTDTSNLNATATSSATITAAPPNENRVMAGWQPISSSSVQLYAVGTGGASSTVPLLAAPVITSQAGGFSIGGLYHCPSPGTQVYLEARGGNPGLASGTNNAAIALIAALGSCASLSSSSAYITVDEVSTIAAVWPGSGYLSSALQFGTNDPRDLSNAFVDSANLASIASGTPTYPGIAIANQDLAIRSLANSLDACVSSNGDASFGSPCGVLFAAATLPRGSIPADTASAARALALNPALSVSAIYYVAAPNPPFEPTLTGPPADWSLGLPHPVPTSFNGTLNHITVFIGDSITNEWPLPANNAGIGGLHASEVLTLFSGDVLGHGYARVVLLAGSNDILYPIAGSDQALQQIETMAGIGRAAGIEVVLCELPPITANPSYYNPLQVTFNTALADFAMTNGYLLVDYYTPMVGHPEYFTDGIHPNALGYAVMEAALSSVVEQ